MEPDYPAAHSMDCTWFAVDRDGCVAIFESGEAGAMPEEAYGGEEDDTTPLVVALKIPIKNQYGGPAPDWGKRLYVYHHGNKYENWAAGPYTLDSVPPNPATVDQLPAELQHQVKGARFEHLTFAETPELQPIEHMACDSWSYAYVTGDGRKIRPVPGMEEEYAEEYSEIEGNDVDGYEVEPPDPALVKPRKASPPAAAKKPWWWPF